MKKLLIAGAFALLFASPALAGGRDDDNSCKGNCPSNGGAPSSSTSTGVGVGVGVGVGIGQGGAGGQGGEGGRGGAGGVGLGGSSVVDLSIGPNVAGAYAGGSTSSAAGGAATATGGSIGDTTATGTGGHVGDVKPTQTVHVDGDTYERAPVSSAFAIGSAGVGEGMCRFGPGVGAQGITAGYNFSLPIFADKLCKSLAKDAGLIRKAALIAQIAGNEAAVQYIASKDAEVNAAITLARTPR